MSNLNKSKNTSLAISLAGFVISVASLTMSISTMNSLNELQAQNDAYRVQIEMYASELKAIQRMDLDGDGLFGTPNWGPEQQPVQDNDPDLINPSKPLSVPSYGEPQYILESPTAEYPFGGYEGRRIEIPIEQDGNVWSVLDAYNASSPTPLSSEANVELINNLVAELDRQMEEGRDPSLVYPGEMLTIDLTYEPSPNGTMVPPGESAPAGRVEVPQGEGENPYFDGTPPSTNPDLGTSRPESSSVSNEVNSAPLVPDCENVVYISERTGNVTNVHGICMDE